MRFFALLALLLAFAVPTHVAQADFLTDADKARLQSQLDSLNAEISEWQAVIDQTKAKKASLQGDVTALNALIKKATAEIQARNLSIKKLTDEIAAKQKNISALEEQLSRGRASLSQILRIRNQADDQSLAEMVLSSEDVTATFADLDALATLGRDLSRLFEELVAVKKEEEAEKAALSDRQNQELDARHDVEVTKKAIAKSEAEKSQLLKITTDAQKSYEVVLADRARKAEQIKSALFPLRDVEGISFGDALNAAAQAGAATGVRAALILAVLSQESDLGKNVGSCYVTNLSTGDGMGKNTGTPFQKVMKAPRDTVPFERIAEGVGKLWGATPVSCPLGVTYTSSRGYGGAMGPSQFIPSTWELFESRLRTALNLGSAVPNPWNANHAIMATALYLKDLGAAGGTYTAERNAACRYYSGRACDTKRPTNYTYGDSVIKKADDFQSNIDFLKGV
jgi:membrane-bound lytic murein transglycosylase B